jgi:hypothetical protein
MGIFRNHGVVFNAATYDWQNGLYTDPVIRAITDNVLTRLRNRGPFRVDIPNAYFDEWTVDNQLIDWIVEGGGRVSRGPIAWTGDTTVEIDARQGQTYLTQQWETPSRGPFYCEWRTNYRVGVYCKASGPGAVTILLQTSSGTQFALATNQLTDQWEDLSAIGSLTSDYPDGPVFGAHVVIVTNEGFTAELSDVSVFEWPTPIDVVPGAPYV